MSSGALMLQARLQHSTIPILSTTQNYRFTTQVYSTMPFWYTCPLIFFCVYLYTEATSRKTAFTNGSGIPKLWGYSPLKKYLQFRHFVV